MNNTIQYSVDSDGIATLLLDLPGEKMNVLNEEMIVDLYECVSKVAIDNNVIGAIVASAKPAFVAGASIKEMVKFHDKGKSAVQGYEDSQKIYHSYQQQKS